MHIILVSDRMATAKSLVLKGRHLLLAGLGFLVLLAFLSTLFSYVAVRHAVEVRLPFMQKVLRASNAAQVARNKRFMRDNLDAMAIKLGKMQARLIRIDTLSARLAAKSGLKSSALPGHGAAKDGQGGPLLHAQPLSALELQDALDAFSKRLETSADTLALLESERISKSMLPTTLPVAAVPWESSGFGWRIDPITGERAMHEGVDFPARIGTPIVAAAAGVVVTAGWHHEYGRLVVIDHGNGLTTRYAHASKILVKVGQLVRRGQEIALVGDTGRTTGPHLHFEVRLNGVAMNPNRFLRVAAHRGHHLASNRR